MTARDKAFAALHAISGAKYLPLEALEKRLRHFGFAEQWVSDTAKEWYREFGLGARRELSGSPLPRREDAPPLVVEEEGPMFAPALCFCGRAVPEAGDFCSQACRSQALEETK